MTPTQQEEPADRQDVGRRTISGVLWQLFAGLGNFISRFGIGILLARLLPPEDFGIIALAYIVIGFATTLTDAGMGPALIQRDVVTDRHVRVCHTTCVGLSTVVMAIIFGFADPIADFFRDPRVGPVLRALSFTFLLTGFGITSRTLLTRRLAFRTIVRIQLLCSIVGYGAVAVAMALAGHGYWSLVTGTIVQALLATVLTYAAARHSLIPLLSRSELRELIGFSAGMSLESMTNYLARQGDYFVVGRVMNATSLGLYSRAYTLMNLPLSFVGSALSQVLFPSASRVQHEPERFRRAYLAAFTLSMAVSMPCSLALSILAPEVILTVYGDAWAGAVPLLQILALFGAFRMSYNTAGAFIRARGQAYRLLASQIIYGAIVIAGSMWVIPIAGLSGVAWNVGAAIIVMWSLMVVFANSAAEVTARDFLAKLGLAAGPPILSSAALLALVAGMRAAGFARVPLILVAGLVFVLVTAACLLYQIRRIGHPTIEAAMRRLLMPIASIPRLRWVSDIILP